jgi:hypothetical protein
MDQIGKKLDWITDAWNDYFLEYKYFQKHISFSPEKRTNYFGDIMRYMVDTFPLVTEKHFTNDPVSHQFNTIGFLQVIYVQQDITDELLRLFSLLQSETADREPNRQLRNELIGHPIRRENSNGPLKSSVFFRFDDPTAFTYVLYNKDNDFKGDIISHSIEEVINRHAQFLHKSFDRIIEKIKTIAKEYMEKLEETEQIITGNIPFKNIVNIANHIFEPIFLLRRIFQKDYLLQYHLLADTHPRYLFAVEYFKAEASEYIKRDREEMEALINPPPETEPVKIRVRFVDIEEEENVVTTPGTQIIDVSETENDPNLSYQLSKLRERHQQFSVDFFLKKFEGKDNLIAELVNMKENYDSDMEYYASMEYLVHLLNQTNLYG